MYNEYEFERLQEIQGEAGGGAREDRSCSLTLVTPLPYLSITTNRIPAEDTPYPHSHFINKSLLHHKTTCPQVRLTKYEHSEKQNKRQSQSKNFVATDSPTGFKFAKVRHRTRAIGNMVDKQTVCHGF